MLFGRKKKKEPHSDDVFLAKGIYLKQPVMDNGHVIFNCFLRCLIVFLLVFGSVGGFLSALRISYNYLLVIFFYLLLSMYFSFLYSMSKLVYRDIGYILFFIVFVASIFVFRVYANSGFYVIINSVLQRAQTFFDLSGVREYEIQITNDYLTVAVVSIFVGMVLIIILNIWICSSMSLVWAVFLTFPLLMIPLYMKLTPDSIYLISLGTGYLAVVIFKANGHYITFSWDKSFRLKGLKKNRITYTQDGTVFRQILLRIVTLGFCTVLLVEMVFPANTFENSFKKDTLREQTADSIANFILLGFSGVFNHYASTGGISGGKLGGISNVRPDSLPDLIVSFAPYSNDAVYLKAYTGGIYGDNEWESIYLAEENLTEGDVAVFEEESLKKEGEMLQEKMFKRGQYSGLGRMDVKNVGADISYLYYPYYTVFDDYSVYNNHSIMSAYQGLGMQQEVSYNYYPKIEWEKELGEVVPKKMDYTRIDAMYLDVPEKNKGIIGEECEKIGLTASMTENEIVERVREYFEENIPYTLKPGATPDGEDFVNYFLTKNRKGYCAHFATAATLIFREMGIPARYVEGYAFSMETVLASEENDTKQYEDYYEGYSEIGTSTVMDVEVTDAMAHAWVEIYVDGFGWKVVEVTPGSNEATDEDDFWSAFTAMLDRFGGNDDIDNNGGNGLGELRLSEYMWLVYVMLGIFAACGCIFMVRIVVRKGIRYRKCHQKNRREAVIANYADICDMIRVCDEKFNGCRSHGEQMLYITVRYVAIPERELLCRQLEQISFSEDGIEEETLVKLSECLKQIRNAIWKKERWKNRIRLCKR